MSLLAIDPGKNTGRSNQGTGFAFFNDQNLLECAGKGEPEFVVGPLRDFHLYDEDLVIIEQPRWYPKEREVDVNDLLDLAVIVGRYAGRLERCRVELVNPRDWKGTVPPDIMAERIVEELCAAELARVPRRPRAKDIDHNVSDAIGIGLWKSGRLH